MDPGQHSNPLATFPYQLLSYILSQLPAKTAFLVRRVCKRWYHLINDPEYIKANLKSSKCSNSLSLILRGEKFFYVDFQMLDKAMRSTI